MRLLKSVLLSSLLITISHAATVDLDNAVAASPARANVVVETKKLFESFQQKTTSILCKILERDGSVSISNESSQIEIMKAISNRLKELMEKVRLLEEAQVTAGNENAKANQELEILRKKTLEIEHALDAAILKEKDLVDQISTLKNSEREALDKAAEDKLSIQKLEAELTDAKAVVADLNQRLLSANKTIQEKQSLEAKAYDQLRNLMQSQMDEMDSI